ncbi:hypothetical protein N431DRAFT_451454 [Stipitochalara longipes BDJ]|nr:hypothetical protein N431DRAFT_451454 [Stipitochalara longipes BDJ]
MSGDSARPIGPYAQILSQLGAIRCQPAAGAKLRHFLLASDRKIQHDDRSSGSVHGGMCDKLRGSSEDGMDVLRTADLDQSHPRLDVGVPHRAAYRAMSAAPTLGFEARFAPLTVFLWSRDLKLCAQFTARVHGALDSFNRVLGPCVIMRAAFLNSGLSPNSRARCCARGTSALGSSKAQEDGFLDAKLLEEKASSKSQKSEWMFFCKQKMQLDHISIQCITGMEVNILNLERPLQYVQLKILWQEAVNISYDTNVLL